MKTPYGLLSTTILVIVLTLTLTLIGQTTHSVKTIIKKNDISSMMGKPVYESTTDSLNTKVWIVTQKKNKELMKTKIGKMKDKNMEMDSATKEAMTAGTHCIIVDVINMTNGKEIADTKAKVQVVSPSEKIISVILQPMMNYSGGGVSLKEKGIYLLTINVNVGAGYQTAQFKYVVK